jgi:capsular exopolysaccharide synthesis family protein
MAEQETQNQTGAGMQEIIEMIMRRRLLFFLPLTIILVASLIIGLLLRRTYEASSVIQVHTRQMIDPLVHGLAVAPDVKDEFDTLSKQITTWPRLEQLVTQLHLADDVTSPLEREDLIVALSKRVNVRIKSKDMLEIAYQDKNPQVAQQVANTLTQNFIDENARLGKEEARNAIDFIGEQLNIYRDKLAHSQQDFSVSKLDADLRVAQNKRSLLLERMKNLQKIIPFQVTAEQSPVIGQLQTRLGMLETELARLMLDAKDDNPRVEQLRREITGIENKVNAELARQMVKERISTFNPLYLQAEQELKAVEMDIRNLQQHQTELKKDGQDIEREISEQELANLERNKKVDEDIYQMFLKQLESAYVSERLQDSGKGSRFGIIEYARLPLRPVKPKMAQVAAIGLLGGIMVGFGGVFIVDNWGRSFQTAEQVRHSLQLTALGAVSKIVPETRDEESIAAEVRETIKKYIQNHRMFSKMKFVSPHVARKVFDTGLSPQIVIYHEPECRVSEEFRVIRTNIHQGLNLKGSHKTILVTSTLRGEGKSTTSANLAVAMADSGSRTLLIDCDLRRGTVHDLFACPRSPGLSDVLAGAASIGDALRQTINGKLTVLPCGSKHHRPSELLGSPPMADLLKELKRQYDTILMDASPVLNLPDPCVLSKYCDCIIMVIQSGRTRCKDVENALSLLTQVNARPSGFVLTNVQYYMPKYIYDYYYEN